MWLESETRKLLVQITSLYGLDGGDVIFGLSCGVLRGWILLLRMQHT